MLIDDIPDKLTGTEVGDTVFVKYPDKVLKQMLRLIRRMGWEYRVEPHGDGTLLHCTRSGLSIGDDHDRPQS